MAELTSAFPTAGGPYWWAREARRRRLELVHRLDQHRRPGRDRRLGRLRRGDLPQHHARRLRGRHLRDQLRRHRARPGRAVRLLFVLILVLYTLVNIFGDRVLALVNNISVGWHVLGVAVIIAPARLRARRPPGLRLRLHARSSTSSASASGSVTSAGLLVPGAAARLPADDVHADRLRRLRPHRRGDPRRRDRRGAGRLARGVLVGGDRLVRAAGAPLRGDRRRARSTTPAAPRTRSSPRALADHLWAAKLILIIVTVGQLFCGAAGLTSASRTWYAFSRDRAMPGWCAVPAPEPRQGAALRGDRGRRSSSLIITIPALGAPMRRRPSPGRSSPWSGSAPSASTSPTSIPSTCGCAQGDSFEAGPWNLGRHYRWINTRRDRLGGRSRWSSSSCRSGRRACPGSTSSTRRRSTTRRWCS